MSVLTRFQLGKVWMKALIFERASRKFECAVCGERVNGLLVRHRDPIKKDTGICHKCLVVISLGKPVVLGDEGTKFGEYNKKNIVHAHQQRVNRSNATKANKKAKAAVTAVEAKENAEVVSKTPTKGISPFTKSKSE